MESGRGIMLLISTVLGWHHVYLVLLIIAQSNTAAYKPHPDGVRV